MTILKTIIEKLQPQNQPIFLTSQEQNSLVELLIWVDNLRGNIPENLVDIIFKNIEQKSIQSICGHQCHKLRHKGEECATCQSNTQA